MQEQDGFRENTCCKNRTVTPLCCPLATDYPLIRTQAVDTKMRCYGVARTMH